jgi:hypothetical protein
VIYEHPLAYLLGLEGVALMRGFIGEYDRDFVEARIAEVRDLLADESLADAAVAVERVGTVDGYRVWSATYDGRNSAFDFDRRHHRHHRPSPVLRPGRCGGPQRRGAGRDRPAAVHPQAHPVARAVRATGSNAQHPTRQ